MNRCLCALRRLLVTGALGAAVLLVPVAAAAAESDQPHVTIQGFATCDTNSGTWSVVWAVSNPNGVAGTIGNVRVSPPYPLGETPNRLLPGGAITTTQRFPGYLEAASLTLDVNWDNGVVTYNESGVISVGQCGQTSSPAPPYVIVDTVCDSAAYEWVITYNIFNPNMVAGTIGNVRVSPPGRPLVGLPVRLYPQQTISGTQRIPANQYTASITFDITWDNGALTLNVYRPVYIKNGNCAANG